VKYQLESAFIANHYFSVTLARTHDQLPYVHMLRSSLNCIDNQFIHS